MIDPTELTSTLQNFSNIIYSPSITAELATASQEFAALNVDLVGRAIPSANEVSTKLAEAASLLGSVSSLIPRAGEEINNGIKALSSPLNDFPSDAPARALAGATTTMGNLQLQIPGLQHAFGEVTASIALAQAKIIPALNTAQQSVAAAIAGSEVTATFNNIALTLPTPLAVSEVMGAISVATQKVIPDVSLVLSTEISSAISGAISELGNLTGVNSALAQLSGVFSSIQLPNLGFNFGADGIRDIAGATLLNASGLLSKNVADVLPTITGIPLLDTLHDTLQTTLAVKASLGLSSNEPGVGKLINGVIKELTFGTVSNALTLLENSPSISVNVTADLSKFESKLLSLQFSYGSVGGMIKTAIADQLGLTNIISQVSGLAATFGIVNNLEEGYAELISSPTPVNSIQVGWTETYIDDVVTKDTIIPQNYYHYIIMKDGTIQRGKQIGSESEIRIAVAGGYNVSRGEFGILSENSINFSQIQALKLLLEQMVTAIPGAQVYGVGQAAIESGDFNASGIDPGIDISQLMKSITGQTQDTSASTAMSPRVEDQGLSTSPHVIYCPGFENKTRGLKIHPQLMGILINTCVQTGLYATVVSGGQMTLSECKSLGGRQSGEKWFVPGISSSVRVGSTRHDNGWAADLTVYRDESRSSALNFSVNDTTDADVLGFVRACRAAGIQAVGAGPGYMAAAKAIHIDIAAGKGVGAGPGTHWGKDDRIANAPQWLKDIMA